MKPECEAAVRAAAGARQLSDADIRAIEQRLQSSAKALRRADPDAWQGMSPAERYGAAAKHARETHLQQIASGHAATLRRVQVKLQNDALIDALPAGKQLDGIVVDTFLTHGKSQVNPTEARIRALRTWVKGRLTGAEERYLEDPTKADALAKEAAGEDSGNARAKAVTKKWQAVQEALRARLERAGVPIHALENWRSPQPWEWTRIRDRETFVQDMLGWVDPREFTNADGSQQSTAQLRHTLEEAWLTLKTNGANKRAESTRARGLGANVGARYNATRQLHFKDGPSWLAAMRKYGQSDDIGGILRHHWANVTRDIAIAETHGPMADADFRERVARAEANDIAAATSEKQARKAAAKAKWALDQWDVLTRGQSPGNLHVAAFMGMVRSVMSASKLGVLWSQQPSDALMSMNFLKLIGMHTGHFARDFAAGLNGSGERAAWMRTAGAWLDSAHETTARFGDTEVWNRASQFLNQTVYVRSGMRAFDRANTSAIAGSFYGTLGEHLATGKAFDALPAASREFLAKHGMTAEHWDVLRKVQLSRIPGDDRAVLNPADVYSVPDEALRALAEKRVAGTNVELQQRAAQREDLALAYRAQIEKAVADETARIKDEVTGNLLGAFEDVMHAAGRGYAPTSISERARLGLTKFEAGTIPGEMARMFYMIRQVPFGLAFTHLLDVPRGMDGWAPRAQYVLRYMAGQAIATGIGLQLKHLVAGEDPENMASWKFAGKVAAGAGVGPLLATLFFGSGGEHQDSLGKWLGPGGEAFNTALELQQQIRDDVGKEGNVDWGKVGNRIVSFARSNAAPFTNFWYTKAAFNHLIYQQLQEAVSPGYNERVQQRMRQRQASQWWQNGQMVPQRAPDVGAAVGAPPPAP